MIGYTNVGTNDIKRGAPFYDALAKELGFGRVFEDDKYVWYGTEGGVGGVILTVPFDGKPATVGNGDMIALEAKSPEQVDRIHKLALEMGGTDEGAPGERFPGFYAGYFRDLDGNKLNAYHMGDAAPKSMIGYVTVGTNDLQKGAVFYDAISAELGVKRMGGTDRYIAWGVPNGAPGVGLTLPFDGKPATVGNGFMVAFKADSREQVDRIHKVALELGGTDEGSPGERYPGFYAGYFRDFDGNKVNAYFSG